LKAYVIAWNMNPANQHHPAEGSFHSLGEANNLVAVVLRSRPDLVQAAIDGARRPQDIRLRFGYDTGYEAYQPQADLAPVIRTTYWVEVWITHDPNPKGRGYRVITAYPMNQTPNETNKKSVDNGAIEMAHPNPAPIFFDWASHVVDITRDYNATNEFLILLALDNLHNGNVDKSALSELKGIFIELGSGRYTEKELSSLWRRTNSRVYPRISNEFFRAAADITDQYIRTGGKNADILWKNYYGGK
jgi:hypothetical protein